MTEEPRISEDGRFFWDGERWQPMAPQRSDGRMPGQTLPTPVLIALVVIMTLVVFFLISMFLVEGDY